MLVFLMGAGVFVQRFLGIAKGEDILVGAFGALLGALKLVHSNLTRIKDEDSDATVDTRVVEHKVSKPSESEVNPPILQDTTPGRKP